ncbi:peptide/nickel transport system permease protein [Amycolatopsis arida]|uniref:Peptide/nickel transport system permease protein n=1 Tax=Amycolatopsis arida TaxID=587909 RepID=A0A1I5LT21_9PSEU|nr:ABC transporter permease [Amycolatopsis arida]TDX93829.1 peptide/nickel transport system permease protein [Amycolatopsis arida]SFP00287.1 peptide/nickel transport system permease protein [Amycolatopsis arida]
MTMGTALSRVTGMAARPQLVTVPAGLGRRLRAHRGFVAGVAFLTVVGLLALVGPLFADAAVTPDYRDQLAPPSAEHWLGTDQAGRDALARTVAAARTSLGAALLVFAITTAAGLLLGVAAGLLGGVVDAVLNRLVDILLGLPTLVLSLAVVGALGPGFGTLVLAMTVTEWARPAKLARAHTLGGMRRPDVVAARMAGASTWRVAAGHVLPGALTQVLIAATLGFGEVVLFLSGLSFLGLGAQPPTPEWGAMLAETRESYAVAPWLLVGPGVGLVLCLAGAALVSEALRDCTDPAERS